MRSCIGSFRFDRSYLGFKSLHTNYKHPTKKKTITNPQTHKAKRSIKPAARGLAGVKFLLDKLVRIKRGQRPFVAPAGAKSPSEELRIG